ncbi:helix-turn-helix domain-containing protein [Aromatoleum evansii]|uniref:Helix-turn-helix domain-containing protein n=1 Tax=Aromatoleum evansii TaxID=59406 RepID=A0ABZ1AJV7_AROEV|nr:helix-turn-helix domain-containing protein [Aromatoleum evansii]
MHAPRCGNSLPRVAILAFPETTASVLYGMHDLFHSAGRDWGLIEHGAPGLSLMAPVVVSVDGAPLTVGNGVRVCPDCRLDATPQPDLVCIPEIAVMPNDELLQRFEPECAWLRGAYAGGAVIASACSGALLMAQAGLLDDEPATTHWAFCGTLAERFPRVRVQCQRSLVVAGDGQRLVMAGGGTTWQDLALYLIARFAGVEPAMQLARMNLIDWHHVGQQPFARLSASRQTDDALIARAQVWAATHYVEAAPVAAMAELTGLSERAFVRRFRQVTGMSPLAYVHTVRIEEAKQMLESTRLPVEAIAEELGYEDASFFSRLFKREVKLTPARYRRKFGDLREVLREAAGHAH